MELTFPVLLIIIKHLPYSSSIFQSFFSCLHLHMPRRQYLPLSDLTAAFGGPYDSLLFPLLPYKKKSTVSINIHQILNTFPSQVWKKKYNTKLVNICTKGKRENRGIIDEGQISELQIRTFHMADRNFDMFSKKDYENVKMLKKLPVKQWRKKWRPSFNKVTLSVNLLHVCSLQNYSNLNNCLNIISILIIL